MQVDSNSSDLKSQGKAFRRSLNTMLFEVHSKQGLRVNMGIIVLVVVSVFISMTGTLKGIDGIWLECIRMM